MLLSLAELWADLWLRRKLAGLQSPFAPSPRAGLLEARMAEEDNSGSRKQG